MYAIEFQRIRHWPGWRLIYISALLILFITLALGSLIYLQPSSVGSFDLHVGRVAPTDILAPLDITYESEILTAQEREAAAQAVSLVYTPTHTSIARQQTDQLRAALTFISSVRADEFATREQMLADIALVENNALEPDIVEQILSFRDDQWQAVQQEAVLVLQQVMRSAIREDQVADARRGIPNLVSLSLPENQAMIAAELAVIFVAPNSFYSEPLTESLREQAREGITLVTRSFIRGETVVPRGQVISAVDLEALRQLGMIQSDDNPLNFINAVVLLTLTTAFSFLYFHRQPSLTQSPRQVIFIAASFLIFLFGARISILGHTVLPFLYPVAAFSLLITALFGTQSGLILSVPLSLLITYGIPNALELTIYYVVTSMFGVLMLGRGQRVTSFFRAGVAAASIGAAIVLTYRILDPLTDPVGLLTLVGAAFVNGAVSGGLTILLQFFAAQPLGMTTALQLLELSRPDHPLLRFVLLSAPGTYQHSLQIANLSEQAAERIGADPLLTRVGALYHDVGKGVNPQFFIENHVPGTPNVHDSLQPLESSKIIIRHVTDGLDLARKHRLPIRIQEFISEHHGTMITRYQYVKAVQAADGDEAVVNVEDFRYPGPQPQSRETVLVMLADGCEARARAERPETEADLIAMIKDTISNYMTNSQLDETDISIRELNIVLQSFTNTLRGIYHPRIAYPKLEPRTEPPTSPRQQLETPPTSPQHKRPDTTV